MKYLISESESRLLDIVRRNEPVSIGRLSKITGEQLGWHRPQMVRVLRRLTDKGFCVRTWKTVSVAITQEQVDNIENGGIADFIRANFDTADDTSA